MGNKYATILDNILSDKDYQANIKWGKPRRGHPEDTVEAHIKQLEKTLEGFRSDLYGDDEYYKLQVLIHVHDTFKKDSTSGVPIEDPKSHATLARKFLEKFTNEKDLIIMVQHHDEGYALWRQFQKNNKYNKKRLVDLVESLNAMKTADNDPLELFLIFCTIDGTSEGKDGQPVRWFLKEVKAIQPDIEIDENWLP